MGGGIYSSKRRMLRSESLGYTTKTKGELFTAKSINNAMSPHGITTRESRDSKEHPNSLAIIIALDVTGSMGSIPHHLVKEGLPQIMQKIIDHKIADPQVLFLGIGDHECDFSPLQVGQFESSDELLDKWLTDVYLEGGGGANGGESYSLAWYFASQHTVIDCFEKRNQKGILFTIGDEPTLPEIPKSALKAIMGDGQYSNCSSSDLFQEASKKYEVYHIHIKETTSGSRRDRIDHWTQLIQDNLLIADRHEEVSELIANTVIKHSSSSNSQIENIEPEKAEEIFL